MTDQVISLINNSGQLWVC